MILPLALALLCSSIAHGSRRIPSTSEQARCTVVSPLTKLQLSTSGMSWAIGAVVSVGRCKCRSNCNRLSMNELSRLSELVKFRKLTRWWSVYSSNFLMVPRRPISGMYSSDRYGAVRSGKNAALRRSLSNLSRYIMWPRYSVNRSSRLLPQLVGRSVDLCGRNMLLRYLVPTLRYARAVLSKHNRASL